MPRLTPRRILRYANPLTWAQSALKATTGTGPFIGPGDFRYDSFMGIGQASGHLANTPMGRIEIANSAVWVHAAIQARAKAVKNVPLRLMEAVPNGIDRPVDGHPILELLATVNPYSDSESSLRVNIEQSLSIHGRYQILKVRNDAEVVKELYGLPTQYCQPIPDAKTFIKEFRYRIGNTQTTYDPKDVIYFRYPSYDGSVEGVGPLQIAVETTKADINIARAQNSISENGARPSMLVTLENKVEDSDYERLMEQLIKNYAGVSNAGKILLIDNASEAKIQNYQLSPRELEWVKEHAAHAKDICAAFQVPPVVAGDYSESSVLSNAGAAHRFFWELWVLPELEDWEDTLNWQLLWTEDWGHGVGWEAQQGFYLKHDVSNVAALREDENSRATRATQMFTSGATINQTLEMRGLPPLPGARGNTILVPQNLLPLDTIMATIPPGDNADYPGDNPEAGSVSADTALDLSESDRANRARTWQGGEYVRQGPPSSRAGRSRSQMQVTSMQAPANNGKSISRDARADLRRWRDVAKKSVARAARFESEHLDPSLVEALRSTLVRQGGDVFLERANALLKTREEEEVKVSPDDNRLVSLEDSLRLTLVALVRRFFQDHDSEKLKQEFYNALSHGLLAVLLMEDANPSDAERSLYQAELARQEGFASAFIASLRDGDLTLAQAEARATLYGSCLSVFASQLELAGNLKDEYIWKMDPLAEHCPDCLNLSGTVHPAEYWLNHQVPGDGQTECLMHCHCTLERKR